MMMKATLTTLAALSLFSTALAAPLNSTQPNLSKRADRLSYETWMFDPGYHIDDALKSRPPVPVEEFLNSKQGSNHTRIPTTIIHTGDNMPRNHFPCIEINGTLMCQREKYPNLYEQEWDFTQLKGFAEKIATNGFPVNILKYWEWRPLHGKECHIHCHKKFQLMFHDEMSLSGDHW